MERSEKQVIFSYVANSRSAQASKRKKGKKGREKCENRLIAVGFLVDFNVIVLYSSGLKIHNRLCSFS